MFENINWLAVLVSTVAMMFLGYVWYSMPIFGRAWSQLIGKQEADLKSGAGKAMGIMVLMAALQAITLGIVFDWTGLAYEWMNGLNVGLTIGLGLLLPVMASSILFEQRPAKLLLITWGYQLVSVVIVSVIMSVWPA